MDSSLMSILDVKENKWISHQIIKSVRTSSLYVLDRWKETSKLIWLDDKKNLQFYHKTENGYLDKFTYEPITVKIIEIFDNSLKKNEGIHILVDEKSNSAPISLR